jgi:hypothetical protein
MVVLLMKLIRKQEPNVLPSPLGEKYAMWVGVGVRT